MGLQTLPLWVPLQADGVTQVQHPAELLRAMGRAISPRSGVVRPPTNISATNAGGDFAATVVGGSMQLTIAAGAAFALGRETTLQSAGSYFAFSEASETISWPAAGGSNRMDSLILRFADPQYGSIGGNPLGAWWDAVAGSSASARADSDFLAAGAKYIPGGWLRMYDVLVPTGATQLTQANVAFKAGYSNALGYTPFFSTARPTGLFIGEAGAEVDTGYTYHWSGTKWLRDETRIVSSTDHSWTSTTTLTDLTSTDTTPNGGFSFPVEANSRYRWTLDLHIVSITAGSLAVQGAQPASCTSDLSWLGNNTGGTFSNGISQSQTGTTFGASQFGGNCRATIHGMTVTGATAGVLKFQFAQVVSNASASWIVKGSEYSMKQVG